MSECTSSEVALSPLSALDEAWGVFKPFVEMVEPQHGSSLHPTCHPLEEGGRTKNIHIGFYEDKTLTFRVVHYSS